MSSPRGDAAEQPKWTLRTSNTPEEKAMAAALLADNAAEIVKLLKETENAAVFMRKRLPAEIHSPAGHVIRSRDCTLTHLLVLFATPSTLHFLKREDFLQPSNFQQRLDLDIELNYLGTSTKRLVRNCPSSHLCAIRDRVDVLSWMIKEGFVRSPQEVNGQGENLLHVCVEEEAVKITRFLLEDREVITRDVLMEMLSRKSIKVNQAPLMKAVMSHESVMLVNMIRIAPKDVLCGLKNITGDEQSIYVFLFSHLRDSRLLVELVKELLRKKVPPDTGSLAKPLGLRSAVACETLALEELSLIVELFCKCGAKISPNVVVALLNSPTRSGDEIISVLKILLNNSESVISTLGGNRSADAGAIRTAKNNGILRALYCPRLNKETINAIMDMFERYTEIPNIFPLPEEVAPYIAEQKLLISMETDLYKILDDPLEFLLANLEKHYTPLKVKKYKASLLYQLMDTLCSKTKFPDYCSKTLSEDIAERFRLVLKILASHKFDFNELTARSFRLPIFQVVHKNMPNEVLLNMLAGLPTSFNIDQQNPMGENLATKCILKFANNFDGLLKVFHVLREKGFDFTKPVMGQNTLLIYYIQKSSKFMHSEDCTSKAKRHPNVAKFFKVFHYMVSNSCDIMTKCTIEGKQITALSEAITLSQEAIVEEILMHHPNSLHDIEPLKLLNFIRLSPHFVDFMSSTEHTTAHEKRVQSWNVHEQLTEQNTEEAKNFDDDVIVNVAQKEDSPDLDERRTSAEAMELLQQESSLRAIWLNYMRLHHDAIFEILDDDESYDKEMELIYDYLVDNVYDETEKCVKSSELDCNVFQHPKDHESVENLNSTLLKKIVEHENLREHPLVTEYLEKFYMNAFLIAFFFTLSHIVFLILLCGYLGRVVTQRGTYHSYQNQVNDIYQGYYKCDVNICTYPDFKTHTVRRDHPSPLFCARPADGCRSCAAQVKSESMCDYRIKFPNSTVYNRCPITYVSHDRWIIPGQFVLLTFCVATLAKELLQLLMDVRGYLKDLGQNMVELTLMGSTILLIVNVSECEWSSGFKEDWQYEVGVVSVLCGWFVMFAYLTRFPAIGTYVLMFYRTVKTLFWVLLSFSSVFLGYAFAFKLLLSNKYPFRTEWTSFLKTFAMMMGELDYENIIDSAFDVDEGKETDKNWKLTHHEVLLRIVFLSFNLLISIVLMNLLVGLTVGDVDQINKEAETQKWQRNIAFADYAEETVKQIWQYRRFFNRILCCCKIPDIQKIVQADDVKTRGIVKRDTSSFSILKTGSIAKLLGFVDGETLQGRLVLLEKRKQKIVPVYRIRHELDIDEDDFILENTIKPQKAMTASAYLPSAFNTQSGDLWGGAYGRIENLSGTGIEDTSELRRLAVPESCANQISEQPVSRDLLVAFPSRHERVSRTSHMPV